MSLGSHPAQTILSPIFQDKQPVNAKELKHALGAPCHYSDWLKRVTTQLGLVEGKDYRMWREGGGIGRPKLVCLLTPPAARLITANTQTTVGDLYRDYLMQCAHSPR